MSFLKRRRKRRTAAGGSSSPAKSTRRKKVYPAEVKMLAVEGNIGGSAQPVPQAVLWSSCRGGKKSGIDSGG